MVADRGSKLRRPALLLALIPSLVITACAGPPESPSDRPCPAAASNVETVDGWVGYLAAHPGDVALVVDDGRGTRGEHRPHEVQPMASASKALNMVAYTRAVATGAVSPDEPVRVGDWERWAVVGGGEDAHARALDNLGIARDGTHARDPDRTVTLDQLVNQMIIWSDNAAPDYLRDRLGDQALVDAAESVGWDDPELPSTTGPDEPEFVDGAPGGTAAQLASLWSAVGHGTFPGADIARRIAEQDPDPGPGLLGVGVKGGSSPGVLARGTEIRRDDGTVGVAVLLVRRMSPDDTATITRSSQAFNDFLTAAVQDRSTLEALRCWAPKPG